MTQQHDLLHWYETSLPQRERKSRGHFSTPPLLVEQVLDACGYTPEADLSRIRVLDPACGSGNFLAAASRRLISYGIQTGLSARTAARYIHHNIWGFDPDPIACMLAELQLHTTFGSSYPRSQALRRLHIHQADGLAFPWQQCGHVDLFLANPPYLAAKNNDLSGYRSTHQRGQADSYLLFLNLALQVVRPGGWIGLVLPDPVLARSNATLERQRLLAETTVHHLWHLADVFAAYVGAVVIVAQKTPAPTHHQINWKRKRWIDTEPDENEPPLQMVTTVSQQLLGQQPGAELRYLLSTIKGTIIERLQRQLHMQVDPQAPRTLACLGEYVLIRRGEELGKDSSFLTNNVPHPNDLKWYPVLRGGIDIQPYTVPAANCWIAREQILKPLDRYLAPKILLVKSAGRLQATLDVHGHVVLQTLYMLQLNTNPPMQPDISAEDELYFLMALLNSRILQDYLYTLYTAYKWVQPQIEQHVLAQLPVPARAAYTEKEQIIARAKLLMHACSKSPSVVELKAQSHELYEEQERAICALYEIALQQRQVSDLSHDIVDEGVSLYG